MRLTSSATKLETDQRATATAINTTLHADIASLNTAVFAFITRTRVGLKQRIAGDVGELTARLDALQATGRNSQKFKFPLKLVCQQMIVKTDFLSMFHSGGYRVGGAGRQCGDEEPD